eukprot:SAG31_NODE_517_length_14689_cov_5.110487_6_plen_223_part_00
MRGRLYSEMGGCRAAAQKERACNASPQLHPAHHGVGALGDGSAYSFGACGLQGLRAEMEDQHCCHTVVPGLDGHAFFAVFDGHGGSMAARFCVKSLLPAVLGQTQLLQQYIRDNDPSKLGEAMSAGYMQCDAELRKTTQRSGTTAVCCFLTPSHVVCANAGDSRAVYCKCGPSLASGFDVSVSAAPQSQQPFSVPASTSLLPAEMSIKSIKTVRTESSLAVK